MSLETNSDLIFAVVAKMVKCSDAKFVTFWKKKFSKKRESEAPKEAEVISKVKNIPTILISEVAVAEAPNIPPEVPRGVDIVGESVEVHDTLEVSETIETPAG